MKYKFYALSCLFLIVCNVGCNQKSYTPTDSTTAQSTDTSTDNNDGDSSSSATSDSPDQSTGGRDSSIIEDVKYKTLSNWLVENESKFVSNVQNKALRFKAVVLKIQVEDSSITVAAVGDEDPLGFYRFAVVFDKRFVDDLAKIEIGQTVELVCTYHSIESVSGNNGTSDRIVVYAGEKITAVKSE